MSNQAQHLKVRKKYEDFLGWLFERVNDFPRKQKFLLGKRIGNTALDIQQLIIEIRYTPKEKREKKLKEFNLKLDVFRNLMRLAWNMEFISHKQFIFQGRRIDEIGRMVHSLAKS